MSKRITFALCAIIIAIASLSAQTFTNGGMTYKVISESAKTCALINGINTPSVTIPDAVNGYTVTEIGNTAFFRLTAVKSVQFPAKLQKIGSHAFIGCTSLNNVDITTSTLKTIDQGAFSECTSLTSLNISNKTFVTVDGLVLNKAKNTVICAAAGLSSFSIPNTVSTIGKSAFYGCKNLRTLTLPNGLQYIDNSAFNECTSLYSVNIPSRVIEIGSSAFYHCESLTSVDIPASVTLIDAGAFGGCTSLTEINIAPDNYTYTNDNGLVLYHDLQTLVAVPGGLHTVTIPDYITVIGSSAFTATAIEYINIPENITAIGSYAFKDCASLKHVVLHEGLEYIDAHAFENCSELYSIIIPESVFEIGSSAFGKCTGMKSVDIQSACAVKPFTFKECTGIENVMLGEDVTRIDMSAFEKCAGIRNIVCYSETPPKLSATAFDNSLYNEAELRVLPECEDSYKNANNWNKFRLAHIEDRLVTAIVLSDAQKSGCVGDRFTLTADVYTQDAYNKNVEWESDDEHVASVDPFGNVTINSMGNCTITAKAVDGSGVEATCFVNALPTGIESNVFNDDEGFVDVYTDVYTIDGKLLIRGLDKTMTGILNPGFYIFKFKNHAEKTCIN